MAAEMASYHGPGTCTFYGTANTNQMLMEFMGLHLPGASFVNPGTPLREALTDGRGRSAPPRSPRLATISARSGEILDERAFVNGIVGLMATGGSTNLVLHLPAMARAAGILLDLQDFAEISRRRAADGQGLSQRAGRREPFPRRRRARLPDRRAAGRGPAAPRRQDHRRRRAGALPAGTEADRRRAGLGRRRRRTR